MRGYMFRNRWLAMLFVALVLAGVTRIVGTGNGDGILDETTAQLEAQRERALALDEGGDSTGFDASDDSATAEEAVVEFVADEELIDPAIGEDPSPADEFVSEDTSQDQESVTEDEILIVDVSAIEAADVEQ